MEKKTLARFSSQGELQTPSFGDPKVHSWTTFWQSLGWIGGHLKAFFRETRVFQTHLYLLDFAILLHCWEGAGAPWIGGWGPHT